VVVRLISDYERETLLLVSSIKWSDVEPTVCGIGSGQEGTQFVIKMRNVKGHAKDTREIVSYHYHYCAWLHVYNKLIVMILSYLENFHMFADGATIEEAVEPAKQTALRHIKFVNFACLFNAVPACTKSATPFLPQQ
jgi:hypothetical protein